jgi:hypothetical protein
MVSDNPERRPLRQRTSSFDGHISRDGVIALFPDDPAYERAYQFAAEALREFGTPMPYASQALIDETLAERAQAAAS